jgi:hypothetical protein
MRLLSQHHAITYYFASILRLLSEHALRYLRSAFIISIYIRKKWRAEIHLVYTVKKLSEIILVGILNSQPFRIVSSVRYNKRTPPEESKFPDERL